MCVSRFNPSEPCCDDAQACAACPSVNWDRYTYTVSYPVNELPEEYDTGTSNGLQWFGDYRFRELNREPMHQIGPCRWNLFGVIEGVTSWGERRTFESAKAEMLGASARPWQAGHQPEQQPYWQPGWYYGKQNRGRVALQTFQAFVEEYEQRIADGEDLPPLPYGTTLGNIETAWANGWFWGNFFGFDNGFDWDGDTWGWAFGQGYAWNGNYPGAMTLNLTDGKWRIGAFGWYWNYFFGYESNNVYEAIDAKDWNCLGENVFRIRPELDEGTAPPVVTIQARRIEPEVPYTYAWRLDESPGNNIESNLHLYGVFT